MNADRVVGCLLGAALGDSLGEGGDPGSGTLLTYTDDTQMTLGLVEELAIHRRLDRASLVERFRTDHLANLPRAYGTGAYYLFHILSRVECPDHDALLRRVGDLLFHDPRGSWGNGAVMRTAPVGLWHRRSGRLKLTRAATAGATTTHLHPEAVDAAVSQSLAVARLLRTKNLVPGAFVLSLVRSARTDRLRQGLRFVRRALEHNFPPGQVAARFPRDESAVGSYPFALYCFLKHTGDFRACVAEAVRHGGDSDTLGAMAGALSGTWLGASKLPTDQTTRLENLDYLVDLARLFARAADGQRLATVVRTLKDHRFAAEVEPVEKKLPWERFDELPLVAAHRLTLPS